MRPELLKTARGAKPGRGKCGETGSELSARGDDGDATRFCPGVAWSVGCYDCSIDHLCEIGASIATAQGIKESDGSRCVMPHDRGVERRVKPPRGLEPVEESAWRRMLNVKTWHKDRGKCDGPRAVGEGQH